MSENSKPTQCKRLLNYLMNHSEGVTQIEALNSLGILRLASRITELKGQGYPIYSEWQKVKNRYGEVANIKRYKLMREEL